MSEVIITLDGHDEELAVFGSRDQYLRQVRDALGVKVLARHGEVRVDGEPDKVLLAKGIFEELRGRHRAHKVVTSADVSDLIENAQRVNDPDRPEHLEIREGNRVVRPRSDGQGRYLRALRDHELVFCIGPAGTGKTYLAVAVAVAALRAARSRRSCSAARPSRRVKNSASSRATSRPKSTRTCGRSSTPCMTLMDYDQIRRYTRRATWWRSRPLAFMRGPDPERRGDHPRRGAEHDRPADEDVPDPDGAELPDRGDRGRDAGGPAERHGERLGGRGGPAQGGAGAANEPSNLDRSDIVPTPAGAGERERVRSPGIDRGVKPAPARALSGPALAAGEAQGGGRP